MWPSRFRARWDQPPARNIPHGFGVAKFGGVHVYMSDYELEPVYEYLPSPVAMITCNRRDRFEAWADQARRRGRDRIPDLGAKTEFKYDLEPGAFNRFDFADRVILKSFFDPPIGDPGIAKGHVVVVPFRGDDTPDYRRASVAFGLAGFLRYARASGTKWCGYALGPTLIVLDKVKGKRAAKAPFIDNAFVGVDFSPTVVEWGSYPQYIPAICDYVSAPREAGPPVGADIGLEIDDWLFLLSAVEPHVDVVDVLEPPWLASLRPSVDDSCRGRLSIHVPKDWAAVWICSLRDTALDGWKSEGFVRDPLGDSFRLRPSSRKIRGTL